MKPIQLFPALAACVAVLAACGGNVASVGGEAFAEHSMHRFEFAAEPSSVCAAVKNVLLGDGYVVSRAAPDEDGLALIGVREFMADDDHPALVQLHASCRGTKAGTAVFATAVESRFEVSQTRQKTSVGIPIVTPLSVATTTTADALLKTGGQTLRDAGIYQRFFSAVARELGVAMPGAAVPGRRP